MYKKHTWENGEVIEADKMNHIESGIEAAEKEPGPPGPAGSPGKPGFSPTVQVEGIQGGHNVIITDENGPHEFNVMDGEKGSDGNPIGTIISFMGLKAPNGYLVCDGSTYKTDDLPGLAAFFKEQFDSEDYFGGSVNEGTFAVPDIRNLFVRGYHGGSNEQLSDEVGKKQEGTEHPFATISTNVLTHYIERGASSSQANNADRINEKQLTFVQANMASGTSTNTKLSYTSRPVNMAVLFCIKATATTWANPPESVLGPPEIAAPQNDMLDNLMFKNMTKSELLDYAAEHGVESVSSAMRKAEIIEAIEGART